MLIKSPILVLELSVPSIPIYFKKANNCKGTGALLVGFWVSPIWNTFYTLAIASNAQKTPQFT